MYWSDVGNGHTARPGFKTACHHYDVFGGICSEVTCHTPWSSPVIHCAPFPLHGLGTWQHRMGAGGVGRSDPFSTVCAAESAQIECHWCADMHVVHTSGLQDPSYVLRSPVLYCPHSGSTISDQSVKQWCRTQLVFLAFSLRNTCTYKSHRNGSLHVFDMLDYLPKIIFGSAFMGSAFNNRLPETCFLITLGLRQF